MDEMWQRHKGFILQVLAGGVLFLVLFLIMHSIYGGDGGPEMMERRNKEAKSARQAQLDSGRSPAQSSIDDQKRIAELAVKQRRQLAGRVGSEAENEVEYVKENIAAICRSIGRPAGDEQSYVDLYNRVPQACLSRLREAAKSSLVGRAAQAGMEIDEALGLGGQFADDEIPATLHGLAIVCDVVNRCFPRSDQDPHPHVERILQIRIDPLDPFPEQMSVPFVGAMGVHMELTGDPADLAELLRTFNSVDKPGQRMIVLKDVPYLVPVSPDEDLSRLAVNLVGLRFKAEGQ